jgi:hypothetical protein
MSTYACAVIAAGSQGRVHAQGCLAAREAGARLVAVADPDGDVPAMQRLAADAGVQLTVNLQRRYEPVHRFARDQIDFR